MITAGLPPHGGGIATYTDKTARALTVAGHEVHVLTTATPEHPHKCLVDGVHIHPLVSTAVRPAVLARSLAVARALRRLGPFDIVQACEWGGEAAVYSLRPQAPLVTRLATPHFIVERLNGTSRAQRRRQVVGRMLERLQTRRSTAVISPTGVLADEVARRWRVDRTAITVIPTGVGPLRVGAAALPDDLTTCRYVLYFGRLEQRKGLEAWIDALPAVLTAHPDVVAVFVGEDAGIRGRPVRAMALERCGELAGRLRFYDQRPQPELFAIVARAALVVIPSLWENLANTCLEAISLGRPVVATSGSGFDDVITHGVDGLLVAPGDSEALAETVVDALADRSGLLRIGEAARLRARDFDMDGMVDRLLGVYRRALGSSSTSATEGRPECA
jgi:glycosyltransferase involved in cell wall biosynthesis